MFLIVLKTVLWLAFFLTAFLLVVVILLQEPKGGGLGEAFGGMGAQTFGVKAGGINKFTFTVFGLFLFSAVMIHALRHQGESKAPISPRIEKPSTPVVPPNPGLPGGGGSGGK
jgi:preprotein translocase subunit SecG